MGASRRIVAVTATVAVCALLAAACGRSANSAGSSAAGNISPTKGLVAGDAGWHQDGAVGHLGRLP